MSDKTDKTIFKWLSKTRDSGKYNMITEISRPLRKEFGLSQDESHLIWRRWADLMENQG